MQKILPKNMLDTENKKNQKIAFVGTTASSALNFRGPLIKHLLRQEHQVFGLVYRLHRKNKTRS